MNKVLAFLLVMFFCAWAGVVIGTSFGGDGLPYAIVVGLLIGITWAYLMREK